MFRTGAQMLLLALLAGLFLLRESRLPPGRTVDEHWVDLLSSVVHRTPPPAPPVTLIAIDDSTLKGHPFPWTPLDYSLFFPAALTFHPDVLAICEVLNWEDATDDVAQRQKLTQYERILKDVLLRSPKTVRGTPKFTRIRPRSSMGMRTFVPRAT